MTKLYRITTIAPKLSGHRDVPIYWFFADARPSPVLPYATAIRDYDATCRENERQYGRHGNEYVADLRHYMEASLDEHFTETEACIFTAWLKKHYGDEATRTEVKEAELPIAPNIMPFGGVPYSPCGMPGCLEVRNSADDPPPFKVAGYYDLRFCEPLSGPQCEQENETEIAF